MTGGDRVMDVRPRCYDKIIQLLEKGVNCPNPLTLDIGEEVNIAHISGHDVTIYPGCRIYGNKTVISEGAMIGYEGPVTIDDCQIGEKVELKGGFFSKSVFLGKSSMGLGAHVREGCILEEEASGAHCVGIKQTILFPFVTLGSLINFCDCLMAGGTSRKNHSEVGSSYIHFNFTPDGDKTTASLIGDVPRGVMLDQPPIFLGGQGGIVGPVRIGYGNVVAANSVLRNDYIEENKLIVGKTYSGRTMDFKSRGYSNIGRVVSLNILYIANLMALEEWYTYVRRPFLETRELGSMMFEGLLDKLKLARKERLKRLRILAEKAQTGLYDKFNEIEALFASPVENKDNDEKRGDFMALSLSARAGADYIDAVKSLDPAARDAGRIWLQGIVEAYCERAAQLVPS
ncbi:MAG: UDP-N-acetylglucosamine pyrophosphorylase [Syntrophorhabdaceae bacterium]